MYMKTLRLIHGKKRLFEFTAENVSWEALPGDAQTLTLHAEGEIVFQEEVAIQEMFAGDAPCVLSVSENGEETLSQRCAFTFLQLDAGSFTGRASFAGA